MAVILSEEQLLLRESAQTFLADQSPVSRMRELRDAVDDTGYTPAIWKQMADLGWLGILLAEEHGGSDMGLGELGVCSRLQCGARHVMRLQVGGAAPPLDEVAERVAEQDRANVQQSIVDVTEYRIGRDEAVG